MDSTDTAATPNLQDSSAETRNMLTELWGDLDVAHLSHLWNHKISNAVVRILSDGNIDRLHKNKLLLKDYFLGKWVSLFDQTKFLISKLDSTNLWDFLLSEGNYKQSLTMYMRQLERAKTEVSWDGELTVEVENSLFTAYRNAWHGALFAGDYDKWIEVLQEWIEKAGVEWRWEDQAYFTYLLWLIEEAQGLWYNAEKLYDEVLEKLSKVGEKLSKELWLVVFNRAMIFTNMDSMRRWRNFFKGFQTQIRFRKQISQISFIYCD